MIHTCTFSTAMRIFFWAVPVPVKLLSKNLRRSVLQMPLGGIHLHYSKTGGKESATATLIRTAADVLGPRGDEKSGCRQGWLAYCKKESKASELTSYRANRFNSLFENAAAVFFHKEDIQVVCQVCVLNLFKVAKCFCRCE